MVETSVVDPIIDITHSEVCDFAKLTMLVYEYGKTFTMNQDKTVESFVEDMINNNKSVIENKLRLDVIKDLSKTSPHGKVHKFFSIDSTDLQVGITISETHKRITVVFRGSESKYDWYYDLSFLKRKLHDDVYVHSGFYKQLHNENVYDEILKEVQDLLEKHPDYNVFVTGHSLGAALSTLFGYELSKEIDKHVTIVSFASPRIGNHEFRKAFDKQDNLTHYRISNHRDIITAAPMILFQHVGINLSLSDDKLEIFKTYDYNTWWKYSLFNCWKVSDHYMDVYYERLLKHKW